MATKDVKKETAPQTVEDKDLEEWAKKLAARPSPQIGVPGASNFLNPAGGGQSGLVRVALVHSGFDIDSAIGRFTWHIVENDKFVPALFRNGELYFCVRMIEISILGDLLKFLPPDIYALTKLDTKPATLVEAKLLSYINSWHCDGFYGPDTFTVNDKLIDLKELKNLYHFLNFSYKVLLNGGANIDQDFSRCGFVRVNNVSLIPYAVLSDGEKGVPLFYFEGHVNKLTATLLEQGSWELSYLKLCCKVQGVRKNLMSGDTVQIVRLADLKGFFPKTSIFVDNCWPPKGKSSLPKLNTLNSGYQPSSSNQNHTHPCNSSAASAGVKWNQQQQQQQQPGKPNNFQQQQRLLNNQRASAPTASTILKLMTQQQQQQQQQPGRSNNFQQQQQLLNNQRTSEPTASTILKLMTQQQQQQQQQQQNLINRNLNGVYPNSNSPKTYSQHIQRQQQQRAHYQLQQSSSSSSMSRGSSNS